MALRLSGSSSGMHKSWQYSVLGRTDYSQAELAHTGATEVPWSTRTQEESFCYKCKDMEEW